VSKEISQVDLSTLSNDQEPGEKISICSEHKTLPPLVHRLLDTSTFP